MKECETNGTCTTSIGYCIQREYDREDWDCKNCCFNGKYEDNICQ